MTSLIRCIPVFAAVVMLSCPLSDSKYFEARADASSNCEKVWTDPDAVPASRSIYQNISFNRRKKEARRKVYDEPSGQNRTLTDAEFSNLDRYLEGLCLSFARDEPSPPPGGFDDVKVIDNRGTRRLGRRKKLILSGQRAAGISRQKQKLRERDPSDI